MNGMNFSFDTDLAVGYKSNSQKIRVMSESWVSHNIFCPSCGSPHISDLPNNMPVADFRCTHCGEIYELKSKSCKIGNKIADGAYTTMLERITSTTNPDLFVMQYSKDLQVVNLTLIPKFFFIPSIIEKRKPLSPNARRAGWTGCNILYSNIPEQGRITIIDNQKLLDISTVVDKYSKVKLLQTNDIEKRGWLFDVLNAVNKISTDVFFLAEVYAFADELELKHPENHHIKDKIRQQLQLLRDKGFIEFLGRGQYRRII